MIIRVMSDLHFEFHKDGGASFVNNLRHGYQHAVLLAGDISNSRGIEDGITQICQKFNCPVIAVSGNHEFYGTPRDTHISRMRTLERELPNFKFLEQETVTIQGRKIVGCTLWFQHSGRRGFLDNDFAHIPAIYSWINPVCQDSLRFLRNNVGKNDIVLTHYLPHPKFVAPEFENSHLNCYFLNEGAAPIVENAEAAVWVCGHTHTSVMGNVGVTKIVCNPYGYNCDENPAFDPNLTLKV